MTTAVLTVQGRPPVPRADGGRGAHNRRLWLRVAVLVIAAGLAAIYLRGRLPDPASAWAVVRRSAPGPLLAAALLQTVSMAAFAEQQRQLLAAFGVRMSAAAALALTYTRSAISIALPGGSAVSAGYAFRAYRARGASETVGVAVMLLSGVASVSGLAMLYGADVVAWVAPSPVTLAALTTGVALVALAVLRTRPIGPDRRAAASRDVVPSTSRLARLRTNVRDTATLAACVPARRWLGVLGFATINWLTDLACLLAAIHAVGLTIPIRDVATAYLATQLIRQVPATPGGIGLIEASLIVALTSTGVALAPTTGAVLVYRLLSCWGLIPTGLLCWAAQRNARKAPTAPESGDDQHDLALIRG